jgi:hypothetical protein
MQSFFVEKSSADSDAATLTFPISATATGNTSVLRSSENTSNKLAIIASNSYASVLTYIAERENGNIYFSDNDSRKIIFEPSDVPEIYSLKESMSGDRIAVGGNSINTDSILIPLGLATTFEGQLSFTFTGMDTYNVDIAFIDSETNRTIDITGLPAYKYLFDYTPPAEGVAENRFFIRIQPVSSKPTGLEKVSGNAHVYSDNHTIYLVSTPSDPIRQVAVYNTQGRLVYSDKEVNASYYTIKDKLNSPEVYVIKLTTGQNVTSVKILLK